MVRFTFLLKLFAFGGQRSDKGKELFGCTRIIATGQLEAMRTLRFGFVEIQNLYVVRFIIRST